MSETSQHLEARFAELFGRKPGIAARAPGRVNLIGEHIDYLGGSVLPIAIGRETRVLLSRSQSDQCRFYSAQFPESGMNLLDIRGLKPQARHSWVNYPAGVAQQFLAKGIPLPGFDMLIDGDIPAGSGLSSSASVEVAAAFALNEFCGAGLKAEDIALLSRRAEHEFAGVPCGVMDQAASACCRAGHALRLDCSVPDLRFAHVPIPSEISFIIAHCGRPRNLGESAYELRVAECAKALQIINDRQPICYPNLCAVPLSILQAAGGILEDEIFNQACFAIEENSRVASFCAALEEGDFAAAGILMNESHFGLRDLYRVSSPELDDLTALARSCAGVYGSRLTGAGFGGCAVTMARRGMENQIMDRLKREYYVPRRIEPILFESAADDGASSIRLGVG